LKSLLLHSSETLLVSLYLNLWHRCGGLCPDLLSGTGCAGLPLNLYVDTTCSARPRMGPQDDVLQVCHL